MKQTLIQQTLRLGLLAVILAACRAVTPEAGLTPVVPPLTSQPPAPYSQPQPILGDVRVREAIADCTNKAELIKSVYPWVTAPEQIETESFVPQDHWAYAGDDPNFTHHPFNQKLGMALLEEAGWKLPDGKAYRTNEAGDVLSLKLTTTSAPFRQTWTAKFAEQMKACGLLILPFYVPPDWLFGESSGLQRRDFEVSAFAWIISPYFDIQSVYPCDQIPNPDNQWMGQNYNGWCNPQVAKAVPAAAYSPESESGQAAYRLIQQKFSADVPSLPLFQRLMVYAINPKLQNFTPDGSELYTWNAAQWQVPGKDTLVILQAQEPSSLLPSETAYPAEALQALVYGLDTTDLNYHYQPVTLASFPTESDGTVTVNTVQVKLGDQIVNSNNQAVTFSPGVTVYDADDQLEPFQDSARLKQLTVTYQFKPGLTWADGAAVSADDYKLAYALTCNLETGAYAYLMINYNCDKIASINYINDSSYAVTWKPGFLHPDYVVPPFGRLPEHLTLQDGRQLRNVPAAEWSKIPELAQTPLGVGPYIVAEWKPGEYIHFSANPYYAGPAPVTTHIVVKFIDSSDKAFELLKNGQADILDPDSFDVTQLTPALLQAQTQGWLKVLSVPSNVYEHLDFNFNRP